MSTRDRERFGTVALWIFWPAVVVIALILLAALLKLAITYLLS